MWNLTIWLMHSLHTSAAHHSSLDTYILRTRHALRNPGITASPCSKDHLVSPNAVPSLLHAVQQLPFAKSARTCSARNATQFLLHLISQIAHVKVNGL
jgi:hypothetical protein